MKLKGDILNKQEHLIGGAISGVSIFLYNQIKLKEWPEFKGMLQTTAIGAIAGILPDLLEPATSSSHRRFSHSIAFGIIFCFVIRGLANNDSITNENKALLKTFRAGYISHLLLDIKTPARLPLV